MQAFATAAAIGLIHAGIAAAETRAGEDVEIDPDAYLGLWYEIARTPAPFQAQCDGGVTARYEQAEGDALRVLNRCDLADGGVSRAEGTAEPVEDDFARLSVELGASDHDDTVDYTVAAIGPEVDGDYAWAAVVGGDAEIGWILAREPELDDAARQEAEDALAEAGVDIAQLGDTRQPPQNYDPEAD